MKDVEFQERMDDIFLDLEDRIDDQELDVDIDSTGGVLTFTFENQSSVILSRQIANHELWVAAKSGGFHLRLKGDDWFCETTSETLEVLINRVFSEQTGAPISLYD